MLWGLNKQTYEKFLDAKGENMCWRLVQAVISLPSANSKDADRNILIVLPLVFILLGSIISFSSMHTS